MLGSAVWTAVVLFASTALAQVSPSGYVTNSNFTLGGSTTFVRDGSTANAFAWTEAVLWNPDSTYTNLGNDYTGLPHSQSVTPSHGAGTYWIQYRLVDEFYNYEDQWISFTVTQPNYAPYVYINAYESFRSYGGTYYTFIADAYDSNGNLSQHYLAYGNLGNPFTSTSVSSGSSDHKEYYNWFVPDGYTDRIYIFAIDSLGAYSWDYVDVYGYTL